MPGVVRPAFLGRLEQLGAPVGRVRRGEEALEAAELEEPPEGQASLRSAL